MTVERTDNEIVIRVSADIDITQVQELLENLEFMETISKSKATEDEIEKLAREAKASSWKKNKEFFLK
ncbi:MAG: hypothetical protein RIC80_09395 [Cyclobacteriaceae bacterium]